MQSLKVATIPIDGERPPSAHCDSDHPYDRVLQALRVLGKLTGRGCKETPSKSRARCPVHPDQRASLCVTRGEDKVLLFCHARCKSSDVLRALGMRWADTFIGVPRKRQARVELAQYDYRDLAGNLVAQKLRFHPKAFRWRAPDALKPHSWRWGLNGAVPGLYRLPQLIDSTRVFVVEGEKSVDLLAELGITATCGHAGAGTWSDQWPLDLWRAGCREVIVLPDADGAGLSHAEAVAASCHLASGDGSDPIQVKVAALPGLCGGADVFDWFQNGHTLADLTGVAADAPLWLPGATEQRRRERKRASTQSDSAASGSGGGKNEPRRCSSPESGCSGSAPRQMDNAVYVSVP